MKPIKPLLPTALLCLSLNVLGQNEKSDKSPAFDFFAKGQNSYTIKENVHWDHAKFLAPRTDVDHSNHTNVDADWTHWFGKGFGAGLSIDATWTGSHFRNPYNPWWQLSRTWTISPKLSY